MLERLGLGEYAQGPMAGDNGWVLRRSTAAESGGLEMTEFVPREQPAGEPGGLPAIAPRSLPGPTS